MRRPLKLYAAFLAPLLLLDWASKAWIRANMAVGSARPDVIDGVLRLWHRTNKGAAWSMFGDQAWGRWFLVVVGCLACLGMAWMARSLKDEEASTGAALGILTAGALGNLADRIRFGEVTDFIDVRAESGPMSWFFNRIARSDHYPTFNVADIAIVAGAILMAILVIRAERKERQAAAAAAEGGPSTTSASAADGAP